MQLCINIDSNLLKYSHAYILGAPSKNGSSNSEGSYQPAYPRSVVKAFTVRFHSPVTETLYSVEYILTYRIGPIRTGRLEQTV